MSTTKETPNMDGEYMLHGYYNAHDSDVRKLEIISTMNALLNMYVY